MSQQVKSEKQLIDAKIAKVREVIRNVSNNDIVLALHNFDMDVNRTIQAFTSGDLSLALGDWEKNGAAKTKNKKKKNKAAAAAESSAATSTTTETPKLSSVAQLPPAQQAPTPQQLKAKPAPPAVAPQATAAPPPATTSHVGAPKQQTAVVDAPPTKPATDSAGDELSRLLDDLDALVGRVRASLAVAPAAERARYAERVAQLAQKLGANVAVRANGSAAAAAAPMQPPAQHHYQHHHAPADVAAAPPQANGQQSSAQANGKPLAQNGKAAASVVVTKALDGAADIAHSVSESSLASSAGEDSGLGQISPVAQEKHVAQISDGGFHLASDALSAEQLAALKAQVAETLKAQGIDTTTLESITGGMSGVTVGARRSRAPPRKEAGKPSGAGAGKENGKPKEPTANAKPGNGTNNKKPTKPAAAKV